MTIFATCEEQINLNELVIVDQYLSGSGIYINPCSYQITQTVRKNHQLDGALISMTENE